MNNGIRYSMCWEDPEIVLSALNINEKDSVLSICSGGENVFAILLKNPKKIIAIDSNLNQIYLAKLKLASITELDYGEFVAFLGFEKSNNRINYYNRIEPYLSVQEKKYWRNNLDSIQRGIIHCGKFENYIRLFREYLLSLILSKSDIKEYLNLKNLDDQKEFFRNRWDGLLWKLLFKIFFSKCIMKNAGRDKTYFKFNANTNIASHYYNRTAYGFTQTLVKKNYFTQYMLSGKIATPFLNHPYLDKKNFVKLKFLVNKIQFVNEDIRAYLKKRSKSYFSKYNLSDIFEMMSQSEYEQLLLEIGRTAKKVALICYWNNLVPRNNHPNITSFKPLTNFSKKAYSKDRVFFYSDFIIEKKI